MSAAGAEADRVQGWEQAKKTSNQEETDQSRELSSLSSSFSGMIKD